MARPLHGPRGDVNAAGEERLLSMRDLLDGQLESVDGWRLGRVADADAEWREDGSLWIADLLVGPEADLGRVSRPVARVGRALLRGRFEHRIPVDDVEELGPTVRLRGTAVDYPLHDVDEWIVTRILRWIPGSGA